MFANDNYYDVALDGIYYRLNKDSKEATVVMGCTEYDEADGWRYGPIKVESYKGDVVIPESIIYGGISYIVSSIEGQKRGLDVISSFGAFEGCSELTSITIPKSIKSIGHQAFAGCTSLKSVYISDLYAWCNINFDLYDRYGNYFPNANPLFFAHALYLNGNKVTELVIPDDIVNIKDGSFIGCDISSVTFHKNITEIGYKAFDDCNSLQSVYISDLTAWCNVDFDLYDRDGNYSPNANPLFFAHALYLNGNKVTELVIPDDIVNIKDGSFIGCDISSVTFHKNITEIGYKAFDDCNNLNDVYCYSPRIETKESFVSHEDKTLHFRKRYKNNYIGDEYVGYEYEEWKKFGKTEYIEGVDSHLYYYVDGVLYKDAIMEVGEAIIPEPTPSKEGYSFSGWSDIPETMPDHDVTVTGSFSPNTYKLTYNVDGVEYKVVEVKFDEAITAEPAPTKKGMTFSGWSEIPEKMPAKDVMVTGTFSWSKVTNGKIIYQVTDTINNYAVVFGCKDAIGGVIIASDVEFDYNYKVTSIADRAFFGCKDVTSIDIPATITNIGERAFAKIDELTDVTITAEDVPTTDRTAFENSYIDYVTLHVPAGSVERYKATGPWKDFKEIVAIEGTEPISVETCVMPTISFQDGKLEFESETDGAECHYEIKVEDAKEGVGSEVSLSSAYEISVYASKEGYNDSEKNSATLYWINVDPNSTGVIENEMRVNTNAILVQNAGGVIAISGVADGENVLVYNISGQLIAQGNVSGNHVEIGTKLSSGDICIIKIADKSVKYLLK